MLRIFNIKLKRINVPSLEVWNQPSVPVSLTIEHDVY